MVKFAILVPVFPFFLCAFVVVCANAQRIGDGAQPTRICNACEDPQPPPPPPPPPQPQWNNWGPWTPCTASCGGGLRTRLRTCNTNCGVCTCQGPATEQQPCNEEQCCAWEGWSAWSECSVTCGTGGVTYRTRQCSCLVCPDGGPASEQLPCSGASQCPCTTCFPPPPPPPCTTCNPPPPPPCNTCGNGIGEGTNGYYDPYRNRRRRQALPQANSIFSSS